MAEGSSNSAQSEENDSEFLTGYKDVGSFAQVSLKSNIFTLLFCVIFLNAGKWFVRELCLLSAKLENSADLQPRGFGITQIAIQFVLSGWYLTRSLPITKATVT